MNVRIRFAVLPLMLAAGLLDGCNRSRVTTHPADPNVAMVSQDDREMSAARAEAQKTLPRFLTALADSRRDGRYYAVKAALPGGSGSLEHIWVEEVTVKDGVFSGKLGNDPLDLPGRKLGDVVTFRQEDVSDWLIQGPNGMEGGYTIKLLKDRAR